MSLRAPFPWFGGKSRAAGAVWPRFGDVPNYIEPFAGSLAILLNRPAAFPARVETVNDVDAYLANFWRAVAADPDAVAAACDWPVNEADLHARHRWLVETGAARLERVKTDPEYFDAKVAGWWVWGQCLWIGSGWCAKPEWTGRAGGGRRARGVQGVIGVAGWAKRPGIGNRGSRGVIGSASSELPQKRPMATGNGQGCGVHRVSHRRPNLGGAGGGQGVQAPRLTHEQLPQLSGDGSGAQRGALSTGVASIGLFEYMRELQARLRRVRVCCGDWARVLTPAVTTYIGVTGVLLDPPYSHAERSICYAHDNDISAEVRAWALEHGDDPKLRIALCGYEGEHEMPATWECVPWTAGGGYGRSVRGKANRFRERIWFSPHCLRVERPPIFAAAEAEDDDPGIDGPIDASILEAVDEAFEEFNA